MHHRTELRRRMSCGNCDSKQPLLLPHTPNSLSNKRSGCTSCRCGSKSGSCEARTRGALWTSVPRPIPRLIPYIIDNLQNFLLVTCCGA